MTTELFISATAAAIGSVATVITARFLDAMPFVFSDIGAKYPYGCKHYGYFRTGGKLEEEIWEVGRWGAVTITREHVIQFKGRMSLPHRSRNVYVELDRCDKKERLFIAFEEPPSNNSPAVGHYLGAGNDGKVESGLGVLSTAKLDENFFEELVKSYQ